MATVDRKALESGDVFKALKKEGIKQRDAREIATVVHALQSRGSLRPAIVSNRHVYGLPFSVEKKKDGTVYVHLKRHLGVRGLGAGNFATVTKSLRIANTGQVTLAAQKVQKKRKGGEEFLSTARREEGFIKNTLKDCKFVIKIHHAGIYVGKGKETKHAMMLEYCDQGSLSSPAFQAMKPADQARLFLKILEGIEGIHTKGIFHGDLTLENILLKTNEEGDIEPRITDFGCALVSGIPVLEPNGTLAYMAPELKNATEMAPVTPSDKIDCYSLGIMAEKIFPGERPEAIQQAIDGLTEQDPNKRMGIAKAMELFKKGIAELPA